MVDFGTRLAEVLDDRGALSLGIDPHPFLLESWGLSDNAAGVLEFGRRVVDAAASVIPIVKPQVAFFERHGSAGFAALETVIRSAREAGLLVIADAKRGDIGSTADAYGQAWLTPGSPLEADAMTLVAYQGVGSVAGPIALAAESGKGVFILAATSNPESRMLQLSRHDGQTVAAGIVTAVNEINQSAAGLGHVGVVIGATVDAGEYGIHSDALTKTPVLAPGFGEQGAQLSDLPALFGPATAHVIAAVSRGALRVGPQALAAELTKLDELRKG